MPISLYLCSNIPPFMKNFINNQFLPPASGQYLDNFAPATGKVYAQIPDSDERDVEAAVLAAKAAFPAWSGTPAAERCRILLRIADLLEARLDEFAKAESEDSGKPFLVAKNVDIPRAVSNFRFFATAAMHFASEAHPMEDGTINYTIRQPLGVVGCISPWNLPLYLFTWKIAPALAAGCCVVGKPSEVTPMTAYMLGEICQEAGLPAGVLNIVHGLGPKAGAALVTHPLVKGISFTGSTRAGAWIAQTAAPLFKKLSLELGGKNPYIVFDDANFEEALSTSVRAAFSNQGQICLCGSRVFVQKSIFEKFKKAFVEKTLALKTGDPAAADTKIGAVVSQTHLEKILGYVALAKEEGGTVLCGGERVHPGGNLDGGYYMNPTVIEGLAWNCRTNLEEIFGPVVTLTPFETEEEVLEMANGTEYGLAASVWTENVSRAHRISAQLQSGIVWVNCWMLRDLRTPFGGVKSSGVGREGGWEAMRFFTEPKNVCISVAKNQ